MKALKKVVRGVTLAELWATALTFVIMVVCYFVSVVNRNFIKGSMPWTEELALYCMVYMALIGTELGLRDGTQVSVTALTEKLKGTMVGKIVNFIAKVALIVFSCTMLRFSVALVAKQMAQRGEAVLPEALLPDYHRLSQAERERAERLAAEAARTEIPEDTAKGKDQHQ